MFLCVYDVIKRKNDFLWRVMQPPSDSELKEIFKIIDHNKDGYITVEELINIAKKFKLVAERDDIIKMVDSFNQPTGRKCTDNIDLHEFIALIKKLYTVVPERIRV
jgi:Ca2+-binding EF-hand superfamily protein